MRVARWPKPKAKTIQLRSISKFKSASNYVSRSVPELVNKSSEGRNTIGTVKILCGVWRQVKATATELMRSHRFLRAGFESGRTRKNVLSGLFTHLA